MAFFVVFMRMTVVCFGVCSFGLDIVLLPLLCLLHSSLYTLPRPHVLLPFDSRSYFLIILFPWLNPHFDILMVTEPESIRGGSSTQRPSRRLDRETTHDDTRRHTTTPGQYDTDTQTYTHTLTEETQHTTMVPLSGRGHHTMASIRRVITWLTTVKTTICGQDIPTSEEGYSRKAVPWSREDSTKTTQKAEQQHDGSRQHTWPKGRVLGTTNCNNSNFDILQPHLRATTHQDNHTNTPTHDDNNIKPHITAETSTTKGRRYQPRKRCLPNGFFLASLFHGKV